MCNAVTQKEKQKPLNWTGQLFKYVRSTCRQTEPADKELTKRSVKIIDIASPVENAKVCNQNHFLNTIARL